MTLDEAREAREALEEVFGIDKNLVSSQEGTDLIVEVGDTQVSYDNLKKLARKFKTSEINFENATCEQGYYGEHSDGHTTLRIARVLDEPPKAKPLARRATCHRSFCGKGATCHCSFCGKGNNEVKKLLAGPTVYICDECVALCQKIIDEGET